MGPQPGVSKSPSHLSDTGDGASRSGEAIVIDDDDAGNERLQANSTSGTSENPSSSYLPASKSHKISSLPFDHKQFLHNKKRPSHGTHKLLASGGHSTPSVKKKRK